MRRFPRRFGDAGEPAVDRTRTLAADVEITAKQRLDKDVADGYSDDDSDGDSDSDEVSPVATLSVDSDVDEVILEAEMHSGQYVADEGDEAVSTVA